MQRRSNKIASTKTLVCLINIDVVQMYTSSSIYIIIVLYLSLSLLWGKFMIKKLTTIHAATLCLRSCLSQGQLKKVLGSICFIYRTLRSLRYTTFAWNIKNLLVKMVTILCYRTKYSRKKILSVLPLPTA